MTHTLARARAVAAIVALAIAVALLAPMSTARAAAPVVAGSEADLGVAIPGKTGSVRSEQSAQGPLADGRYLTYFASSGAPGVSARFFAMGLDGGNAAEVAIPRGTDVLTLVYSASSKTVFVAANAASTGYLYEWDGSALRQVAVLSGHQIMRLAAAPDGGVYIGTFAPSNGRLYRYVAGVVTDLGQPMAGESYVRSLAVDAAAVWVSNYREAAAQLVRVDRRTNARTAVATPAAFRAEWSAFDMTMAGEYLFLRMVNKPLLFVYNTVTGRFDSFDDQIARVYTSPEVENRVAYIDGISPYGISPLFEGRYVYFQRAGAGIMRVDLKGGLKAVRVDRWNKVDNPVSWPGASVAGPVSYAWLSGVGGRTGSSLVTTTIDGKVVINTPGQTGPLSYTLQAQDAPSTIISVGADSAGAVYGGGFDLPSGIARHAAGSTSLLPGPQIEGFGTFGSSLVMGGYTGDSTKSAPLYLYAPGGQPQLKIYINNSQERPVAFTQLGTKVAVGTVPIKNTLGGALTIWDPATNALTVKRNLIPNHSIISLRTSGSLVVGGSSNTGGTGATPTATSGQIFTYDPSTGALKTFTPPRAESATYSWVAAITPDPTQAGHFWALSTGYLIQFKVGTDGSITLTKNLGAMPNTSSPTGKELGIVFVGQTMFATVDQGVVAVNRDTGERTVIAPKTAAGPVVGLVGDGEGSLYYARGVRLYRYSVTSSSSTTTLATPVVTSPDLSASQTPGTFVFAGTGTRNSTVTLSDGSRTRSAMVADDGTWRLGAIDFSAGSHRLTFTASLSGHADQTSTVTLTVSSTATEGPAQCGLVAPQVTNIVTDGYNAPYKDYAFAGTGTPGSLITMVNGTRVRTATVRADGTWSMSPVYFGWWAGTTPFTASKDGCQSVTNEVMATFATKPTTHVAPLVISHTETDFYESGEINFKGKGTPGAFVTMLVGNQTRFAAVSPTGRWHMRSIAVGDAPVTLSFTSTVPGHPARAASFDAHFGPQPTTAIAPLVQSHATGVSAPSGDVLLYGQGTAATKITATIGGRSVSSFVRSNGRWSLPAVAVSPGLREVVVTASSPGLPSATTRMVVLFT